MRHHLLSIWPRSFRVLRQDFQAFETDPAVQYHYHRRMVLFWMVNFIPMNAVVGIDIWATLGGHDKVALLATAVLLAINTNYSLYANWDTEVGDAHGAYASLRADQIQRAQSGVSTTESQVSSHATF